MSKFSFYYTQFHDTIPELCACWRRAGRNSCTIHPKIQFSLSPKVGSERIYSLVIESNWPLRYYRFIHEQMRLIDCSHEIWSCLLLESTYKMNEQMRLIDSSHEIWSCLLLETTYKMNGQMRLIDSSHEIWSCLLLETIYKMNEQIRLIDSSHEIWSCLLLESTYKVNEQMRLIDSPHER